MALNKMNKKLKIILLIVIFALLCGLYFGIGAWKRYMEDEKLAAEEAQATMVVNAESIEAFSYSNGEETLDFFNENGGWVYSEDSEFPLDQSVIGGFADLLSGLTAVRVFENPDNLSAYGLDEPAYVLEVDETDGTRTILKIGDQVNENYYAYVEGSATVYTIGPEAVEFCQNRLYDMVVYEQFPQIEVEDIEEIVMEADSNTIILQKRVMEGAKNAAGDTNTNEEANPQVQWSIVENQIASEAKDSGGINTILSNLSQLSFSGCISYNADESLLAYYDLIDSDKALEVKYKNEGVEKTVRLTFGATSEEEEEMYHVVMNDSKEVVLINATSVDAIFDGINQLSVKQ